MVIQLSLWRADGRSWVSVALIVGDGPRIERWRAPNPGSEAILEAVRQALDELGAVGVRDCDDEGTFG